jgi:ABC-type transport system substrate-binding protein
VTDLTLRKSLAVAVAGVALLASACGGRDQPALGASAEAPISVFESAPSTVSATTAPAVTTGPAVAAPPVVAVNTWSAAAQQTLDDVLGEVDQALADIDSALADTEDSR